MTYKYNKCIITHSTKDEKDDIDEIKSILKSRIEHELGRTLDYDDFASFSIVFNYSGEVPVIHGNLYLDDTLVQLDVEWKDSIPYE